MKNVLWLALLAGCTTDPVDMGQFGEEEPLTCVPDTRTPVGPDEVVTVGYADEASEVLVSDVLALAQGTSTETLVWDATGEATELTVTLADSGAAELVVYVPESDGPCPTRLELPVDVTADTGDGRLAEAFVGQLSTLDGATVYVEGRVSPPGGTVDPVAMSTNQLPVEPDVLRFDIGLGASGFWGSVRPLPIGGVDDDATPLATWPPDVGP